MTSFCVPPRPEPRVFDAVLEQPLDTTWGGFQKQQASASRPPTAKPVQGPRKTAAIRRSFAWRNGWSESTEVGPRCCGSTSSTRRHRTTVPNHSRRPMLGEVEFVDAMAGRLVDGWDAKLGAADTLSVVTADHGEHLDDHGVERGHGTLWITNLRTPLLTRCPGLIETGTVGDELTRQIDVLPTVLDYCAVALPSDVLGMSLRQHISTIAA